MRTSDQIDEIMTALAMAQGEFEVAKKENTNPFFSKGPTKSKYADINNVLIAVRPALAKHGLALIQAPSSTPERMLRMTTRIAHKSGQWVEQDIDFKPKEDTPQALGSCCTYARRYAALGMLSVVCDDPEDDDGNAATFGFEASDKKKEEYNARKAKETDEEKKKENARNNQVDAGKQVFPTHFNKQNPSCINWIREKFLELNVPEVDHEAIIEQYHGILITKDSLEAVIMAAQINREVFA